MYQPPFEITPRIIELISEISEKVGEINSISNSASVVKLRKENRIKTIHSSLAIENNSLSLEQMTAILQGKNVLGSPVEILEVKNAIEAYELLLSLDSCSEGDLLKAHRLMMQGLVDVAGKYRRGNVGIFGGGKVVHVAPPADRVPSLMSDLFSWLAESKDHPLIKACVFHYEFEFIHPFQDGNGRLGRLWHTVILKDWKEIFAWLPVETLIKQNQEKYYDALARSDRSAKSTAFIEFMLGVILATIVEIIETEEVTTKVTRKVTTNQKKIIEAIKANPFATQEELASMLGITRKNVVENMKKLQEMGLVKRVGATKNGYWQAK